MKQSSEHDDHLVLLARVKYINITIKNGHVIEHCRNMASLGYWAEQVDKVNRSQQSCQHTPKLDCGDDDDPAFKDRREQKNTIIKHLYNSAKTLFQLDRVQDTRRKYLYYSAKVQACRGKFKNYRATEDRFDNNQIIV